MTNPTTIEYLAREHQGRLIHEAEVRRLARAAGYRSPLRTGIGELLICIGLRLSPRRPHQPPGSSLSRLPSANSRRAPATTVSVTAAQPMHNHRQRAA